MNPLKKAYCRTFQTGLKIALPFLPYRKPKITGSVCRKSSGRRNAPKR